MDEKGKGGLFLQKKNGDFTMGIVQVKVQDGASSEATTENDGGTVVNGGNLAADSRFTVNKSLAEIADGGEDYGSKVVQKTDGAGNDYAGVIEAKGVGTGTLAFFPNSQEGERNFLIRNVGTADGNNKVNNSTEASLATLGSEYATVGIRSVNAIHKIVDTDLYGSGVDTTFNVLAKPSEAMVPGRTKGTGAGDDSNFVQVADGSTAATDDAASPTRGVPGELTYHFGGLAKPSTDEYKAKDSYEA